MFWCHSASFACAGGRTIRTFYAGSLFLSAVNIGLLLAVIHKSLQGTVINWWPRRRVATLLSVKVSFEILRIFFTIWSTKAAFLTSYGCEDYIVHTMQTAVKSAWLSHGLTLLILGQVLNPFHAIPHGKHMQPQSRAKKTKGKHGKWALEQRVSPVGAIKKVIAQRFGFAFRSRSVHYLEKRALICRCIAKRGNSI